MIVFGLKFECIFVVINLHFNCKYIMSKLHNSQEIEDANLDESKVDESEVLGIKSFPKYSTNPFLNEVISNKKVRGKTVSISTHPIDVGVAEGKTAFIHIRKSIESEQFTKVYNDKIQRLFDLSQKAFKVFGFICKSLEMNKDMVFIDMDKAKKHTGYTSNKTIISAKAELIEKGIIARTISSNLYFVNISIFFNGNRLVIIEDYLKGRNSESSINIKEQKPIQLLSKSSEIEKNIPEELPF